MFGPWGGHPVGPPILGSANVLNYLRLSAVHVVTKIYEKYNNNL